MNNYKIISITLAVIFAIVGLLFLIASDGVLSFFNFISGKIGMRKAPLNYSGFYLILAVGYMYLVTIIAWLMFKHPMNKYFPMLLANAKLASSFLSLFMFIAGHPYLICLVNFIVDGCIGLIALVFYFRLKKGASIIND